MSIVQIPNAPTKQQNPSSATITAYEAVNTAQVTLNNAIAVYQNAVISDQNAALAALGTPDSTPTPSPV